MCTCHCTDARNSVRLQVGVVFSTRGGPRWRFAMSTPPITPPTPPTPSTSLRSGPGPLHPHSHPKQSDLHGNMIYDASHGGRRVHVERGGGWKSPRPIKWCGGVVDSSAPRPDRWRSVAWRGVALMFHAECNYPALCEAYNAGVRPAPPLYLFTAQHGVAGWRCVYSRQSSSSAAYGL